MEADPMAAHVYVYFHGKLQTQARWGSSRIGNSFWEGRQEKTDPLWRHFLLEYLISSAPDTQPSHQ